MTDSTGPGTSGGGAGTNGVSPRLLLALLLFGFFCYGALQTTANVYSSFADRRGIGEVLPLTDIWLVESASLVAWAALIGPIWWLVKRLQPPRISWPAAFGFHLLLSVPVSLAHVGLTVAIREAIYAVAPGTYSFGGDGLIAELIYEYRKDLATYVQFVLILLLIQWIYARYAASRASAGSPILVVPDGAVTHRIPIAEIDHVEAAGNYVALAWRGRTLLHRATLTAVEQELGDGFVRIHRSRLVRRDAIRRVETNQSGDFTVELESGETLKGSRRYRDNLG